ncbi:MAG: hypothetical protein PHW32_01665 [Bacilli bacterium]|nr:hypothetical protein [Bacilli bacterium]MDD4282471.1 hypothetical protein [Bacilli bacterium]MDD4719043.1 hypothetical protein [Bacilli bacterium]
MKKIKKLLIIFLFLFLLPLNISAKEPVEVHLFYSENCTFCKREITFLKDLIEDSDNIIISKYEVSSNTENIDLFNQVRKTLDIKKTNIPLTVIGNNYFIGFNDNIGRKIENAIKYYSTKTHQNLVVEIKNDQFDPDTDKIISDEIEDGFVEVPFLGLVDAKKVSLPILAVIIGLVDGFNPCAMWVLLFLISMLLGMKNKKRMWILGLTFIFTSAFIYLLFMVSWLKITMSITSINWVKLLIGIIAMIGGTVNLRSYFKKRKEADGCTVVDTKKRSKIIDKIRTITAERNMLLAMIGIMFLAISVNIIELACSAGLPLLFTQVLTMNSLSSIEYVIYMLIYILFFLIDDIIVFAIAMITFELTGISTKYSKYSHLIGGIIMLLIGILLVFKPELLSFNI